MSPSGSVKRACVCVSYFRGVVQTEFRFFDARSHIGLIFLEGMEMDVFRLDPSEEQTEVVRCFSSSSAVFVFSF